MIRSLRRAFYTNRVARTLMVWAALALLAALDHAGPRVGLHAGVFSFVISALGWLADALGVVGGAIATSLEAVVGWLVSAVGWITSRIANVVLSTGALFSKVWDGLRTVWSKVLRPALQWVDSTIRRVHDWLATKFRPIFDFLHAVRDHITALYRRFVRPVLNFIDFVHQLNRALSVLHIHVLQGLDDTLQRVESAINERLFWVYGKLNELTNWLNSILDAGGLFQRYILLRSLARDVDYQWRILVNAQRRPLTDYESARIVRAKTVYSAPDLIDQTRAYFRGEDNLVAGVLGEAVRQGLDYFGELS